MVDVITPAERDQVLQALELAKSLRQELARAKRAGIDITELEQRLNEAENSLKRIKQVYITASGLQT